MLHIALPILWTEKPNVTSCTCKARFKIRMFNKVCFQQTVRYLSILKNIAAEGEIFAATRANFHCTSISMFYAYFSNY